jgi:hypothetical protein
VGGENFLKGRVITILAGGVILISVRGAACRLSFVENELMRGRLAVFDLGSATALAGASENTHLIAKLYFVVVYPFAKFMTECGYFIVYDRKIALRTGVIGVSVLRACGGMHLALYELVTECRYLIIYGGKIALRASVFGVAVGSTGRCVYLALYELMAVWCTLLYAAKGAYLGGGTGSRAERVSALLFTATGDEHKHRKQRN